jgi:hypothetical protein
MNRVRPGLLRRADVLLREEVARDLDRLVGGTGVQRALVIGRDDCDRRDPELPARAKDTERDLAAVRDEELPDQTAPALKYALGAFPGAASLGLCVEETWGRLRRRGRRTLWIGHGISVLPGQGPRTQLRPAARSTRRETLKQHSATMFSQLNPCASSARPPRKDATIEEAARSVPVLARNSSIARSCSASALRARSYESSSISPATTHRLPQGYDVVSFSYTRN